jgi:hypothetical protein
MKDEKTKIINAIHHVTNYARLLACKKIEYEKIEYLLDQVDYIFNLMQENDDYTMIRSVLFEIYKKTPLLSKNTILYFPVK